MVSPGRVRRPALHRPKALGSSRRRGWRVGWGLCPHLSSAPRRGVTPWDRAGSLPKTTASQERNLAGPALSSSSPGQAGTHPSAWCGDRAVSEHHLWPVFQSNWMQEVALSPLHKAAWRLLPGAEGRLLSLQVPLQSPVPGCHARICIVP